MAKTPQSVTIRSFQVGFGDCFLLQFNYVGDETRNVLIDFGTTGLPKTLATTPSKYMPEVAARIAEHCGFDAVTGKKGKLHAVVATHRHQDHISGFATDKSNGGSGATIRDLKPDVVVQPWTEDPKAKEDATRATATKRGSTGRIAAFRKGLAVMHEVAAAGVAFAKAELAKGDAKGLSARSLAMLQFVGEDNVSNVSAVQNLIDMGHRRGAKAVYANYGSSSGLEAVLPGVKVTVLGPPSLDQTDSISTMRSRDANEFWQLLAGPARGILPLANGIRQPAAVKGAKRKIGAAPSLPANGRWFARRLAAVRGAQIFEIVTALDNQMNNTSLILLFEFGGRKLLFPGDAQLENWRYALQEVGKGVEAAKNVQRLADIDFYKVGHHGSLNATPKRMLWAHLTRRKAPVTKRLRTMMSTMPGKHPGKVGGIGEVPRKPLLKALKAETILASTDDLKKSKDLGKVEWFQEVTIKALK